MSKSRTRLVFIIPLLGLLYLLHRPDSALAVDNYFKDNVAIGKTGAIAKLDIVSSGSGTGFALRLANTLGVDKLTVLDNGNVGIGTTNPEYKFHVLDGADVDVSLRFSKGSFRVGTDDNGDRYISVTDALTTIFNYGGIDILGPLNGPAPIYIRGGSRTGSYVQIDSGGSEDGDAYIRFDSAGAEKMRMTPGGNLGIGTSNPYGLLQAGTSPNTSGLLVTTYGNVGIGTTRPRQRLEVSGTALVSTLQVGTSATAGFVLVTDASGVGTWQAGGASGGGWTDDGTTVRLSTTTDKVGIGTSNVTAKLDIRGTGTSNGFALRIADSAGTDRLVVLDNGNVGIGTTAPISEGVHISRGNNTYLTLESTLGASSEALLRFRKPGEAVAKWAIGRETWVYGVGNADNLVFYEDDSLAQMTLTSTALLGLGNGLTSPVAKFQIRAEDTGAGFAVLVQDWNQVNKFVILDNGNVGIGTTQPLGLLQVGTAPGVPALIVTSYNNVGIGTTRPRQRLEVSGTALVANLQVGTSATAGNVLTADASGVATWQAASGGGGWVDDGTRVRLATTTDNVGIGASGILAAKLSIQGAGTSIGFALRIADSAGTDRLVVLDNGNVGIGTTVPGKILSVSVTDSSNNPNPAGTCSIELWNISGNLNTGGQILFRQDTGAQTPATAAGISYLSKSSTAAGAKGMLTFSTKVNETDTSLLPRMTINEKGEVGIGTTDPSGSTLELRGSYLNLYPVLALLRDSTNVTDYDSLGKIDFEGVDGVTGIGARIEGMARGTWGGGVDQPAELAFFTAGDSGAVQQRMVISKNGNLGIGESVPLARLDIRGGGTGNNYAFRIIDSLETVRVTVLDKGNVGIGTTVPRQRLEVNGTALVSTLQVGTSATAGQVLTADASGVATWQAASGGGGWVDDGVTVRLSTLTDNVGIGVSGTLAGKLSIRGAGTGLGFALRIADSAGTDRLVVMDNGNIGIGTTFPIGTLSLSTTTDVDDLYIYATTYPNIVFENFAGWAWQLGMGMTASGDDFIIMGGGGDTIRVLLDSHGNLGLGMTSPVAKLDIRGDSSGTNFTVRVSDTAARDRLVVLDNGNVGMGTTVPLGWLQIGTSPAPALLVTGRSNVGIGTTAARQRLDVNGTALVSTLQVGTSATAGNVLTADASGVGTWQATSASAGGWVDDGNIVRLIDGKDNVGIGTTNILGRLGIVGNGTGGGFALRIADSAGTDSLVVLDNGNIGIGTTVPYCPIQIIRSVGGGSAVKMYIRNNNDTGLADVDFENDLGRGGEVGVGGSNASVSAALRSRLYYYSGSNSLGLSFISSDAAADIRFYLGGTSASNEKMRFDINGNLGIGTSTPLGILQVGTAPGLPGLLVTVYNNVGIATTVPRQRLEVNGTALVSTLQVGTSATAGNVLTADASGVATWQAGGSLPSGTAGQTLRYSGAAWVANSVLYNNGTNIGIGITNPTDVLHIVRDMDGDANLTIRNPNSGLSAYAQVQARNDAGNNAILGIGSSAATISGLANRAFVWGSVNSDGVSLVSESSSGDIRFYINGADNPSERMRIEYDGNVGIGMTAPYARLDIKGKGMALGYALRIANSAAADKLVVLDNGNVGMGTTNPLGLLQVGTFPAPALFITGTGNVGIGSTSPPDAFDVVGNTNITMRVTDVQNGAQVHHVISALSPAIPANWFTNIEIGQSRAGNYNLGYIGFHYLASGSLANYLTFGVASADELLNITATGNVGIGTTTPLALLQVGTSPNVPALFVKTSNNVGIGTTSPRQKLDVIGTATVSTLQVGVSATAGQVLTADASGVATWQAGGSLPSGTAGQTLRYSGAAWVANDVLNNNGTNIGIGTTNPTAKLYINPSDTTPSQGIYFASDTNLYRGNPDTLQTDDKFIVGSGSNTFIFDPSAGPTYAGNARITKAITLSPEFNGATLSADDGTNNNGQMTSDTDGSGNAWRNYYKWASTQASLQDYSVILKITLPADWSDWTTNNAVQVNYKTSGASNADSSVTVRINNAADTPATALASSTDQFSASWTTINFNKSDLISGGAPEWDAAGETAVIRIKVKSKSSNAAYIGDVVLNYLAKN